MAERLNWFGSRNPLRRTKEEARENSAKFIKSYSFFDAIPAPYVSAFIRIPNNTSLNLSEKKSPQEAIQQKLNAKERIVRISNPPYNTIKSFNYDVLEGKVEAEFIDAGGTLINLILRQFSNINDAIGTLTITFKYGWSTPTYPIKSQLIDDIANPLPKKINYKTGTLEPKVRFSNYVSAIIEDMELEFTTSGVIFKIIGRNNLATRITPVMEYFKPFSLLGPYPLIEFGAFDNLTSLIKKLDDKNGEIQRQETINLWLTGMGIPETDTQLRTNLIIKIKKILSTIQNDKTAYLSSDKENTIRNVAKTKIENDDDSYATRVYSFYSKLSALIQREITDSDINKKLSNELLFGLLQVSKGGYVPAYDALKYIFDNMYYHIRKMEINIDKKVALVPLLLMDKSALEKKEINKEKAKEIGISGDYYNAIPIKNLTVDTNTTYEVLLKNIANYIKIPKTINKTQELLNVDFNYFVAYGREEIVLKLRSLFETIETTKNETTKENIRKAIYDGFVNSGYKFEKSVNRESSNLLEQIITAISVERIEPVVVFYIFSEYKNSDFFETSDMENLLHGYSYRPGGFQIGLAKGRGKSGKIKWNLEKEDSFLGFYNQNEKEEMSNLKTNLPNVITDQNYFNTGTLNLFHNNFPDVLSFTPKINYNLIRTVLAGLTGKALVDALEIFYVDKTDSVEEIKKRQKDILNQIAQMKKVRDSFEVSNYYSNSLFPNANIISQDSSIDALRIRVGIENFRESLSTLLTHYEAELKIIGEPFYDMLHLNKYINLNVYAPNGDDTIFTGTYLILGVLHEIQDGKFETTLKLTRQNINKTDISPIVAELNSATVVTSSGGGKGKTAKQEIKSSDIKKDEITGQPTNSQGLLKQAQYNKQELDKLKKSGEIANSLTATPQQKLEAAGYDTKNKSKK